jgi:integrase
MSPLETRNPAPPVPGGSSKIPGSGRVEAATCPAAVLQTPNGAKNGKPHLIPLSAEMQTLLRAQPRFGGTDLVFPGERGVFSGWSKSKDRLDHRSGATGWTLHDVRRTVATGLQKLGVRPEVTEAVLNHVSGSRGGIIGVYQRRTWSDEKRAALTAWGAHVDAIVQQSPRGLNIIGLRSNAAQR